MTMQVNIGGTYKDVSSAYVNVGGVWKTANNIYTNIGGVWKDASLVNNGEYELLADYIVPSNTTTVTFSGLNIGKGDEILLSHTIINPIASTVAYYIYTSSTSSSNYYMQYLESSGTIIGSGRINNSTLYANYGNSYTVGSASLKLTNSGYFVYQCTDMRGITQEKTNLYGTSTFTSTSITSLTITASATNAIGTNSRFQLYKIGGAS